MFVIMIDVAYGTFLFIYVGTSPKPMQGTATRNINISKNVRV